MGNTAPTKLSPLQVKRALNRNIVAGSFGMLFATCLSLQFVTQFAIQMGATKFELGLLTSVPMLCYPLQLVSAYLVERIRRRKQFWFVLSVIYRLLWLPMVAIPFLIGRSHQSWQIQLFFGLFFIANALAALTVPPWFSWLADLVPPEQAGRFWSRRTAVLNAVMLSSLLFGKFVDCFDPQSPVPFVILFTVGCILGQIDLLIHYKIPEPAMREQPKPLDLFGMLKEPIRNPQFRRYLIWNCTWSFAVTLYGAYLMVYFLEQLHLSQFFISVLTSVSLVARVFMFRFWGYLADRFGHTVVNTICDFALVIFTAMLLFVTPQNCYWLLIVMHLWAGSFGIGLDTASTSLMLRLSTSENKSMSLAVLYSLVGIIAAAAPPVGGWILHHFEGQQTQFMLWHFDNFQMLFLIGLLLRLLFLPFSLRLDDVGGGATALVVRRLMDTNPFRVIRHVHVLSDSSAEAERVAAVQELASARSALATRELMQALEDPSREVRLEAALALARIGDSESVDALVRCVRSSDSGIQPQAAYALGKLRDARAVPALVEALGDPSLAQSAATALGEIGDRAAGEALWGLFRDPRTTGPTRASLATALSRIKESSALPDMLAMLQTTQSELVRQELALAIGALLGRPGEFYRLLTRERQVAGQDVTRMHEQIARDRGRFRSSPRLIEEVLQQLEQAQASYGNEQWHPACQAYARAGLLLSGSLPGEEHEDGMFTFLTDWFFSSRRRAEEQLARRDSGSAPIWYLLSVAYPQEHGQAPHAAREECLLAFYAFWRIWTGKTT